MSARAAYLLCALVTLAYLACLIAAVAGLGRLIPWSTVRAFHVDGRA